LSPQHLIDAYELLVPEVRRARQRALHSKAELREAKTAKAKTRRGER
jgi:hypothetical protein